MTKLRLLTFSASKNSGPEIASVLDSKFDIINWHTVFSDCLLLETDTDPKLISEVIRQQFPNLNHICVEFFADTASGFLPTAIGREIASKRTR